MCYIFIVQNAISIEFYVMEQCVQKDDTFLEKELQIPTYNKKLNAKKIDSGIILHAKCLLAWRTLIHMHGIDTECCKLKLWVFYMVLILMITCNENFFEWNIFTKLYNIFLIKVTCHFN